MKPIIMIIIMLLAIFLMQEPERAFISDVDCKITCDQHMMQFSNEEIDTMVMSQSGDLMRCPNLNYCYEW